MPTRRILLAATLAAALCAPALAQDKSIGQGMGAALNTASAANA